MVGRRKARTPRTTVLDTIPPVASGNSQPAREADWQRRVVNRSLRSAQQRSIDRGAALVEAASALVERSNGSAFTVQDIADEAGQSLRTLYQYFASKDDLLLAVFEEAMAVYAQMIRDAIAELGDPLERLAGALLAAARLPDLSRPGVNGGLSRLRVQLTEVDPESVGRAQVPLTSLLRGLVDDAVADGSVPPVDAEAATFLVLTLNTATITSVTLGNDVGVGQPSPTEVVAFCLSGLGARRDPDWLDAVAGRLRLPRRRLSLTGPVGRSGSAG
jgi:AcrR family transcriptional regulator